MQNTAKVLLADANEEFRALLAGAIGKTGEFTVVGSTGDGLEALRLAFLRDAALSPGAFLCQMRS